MAAGSEVISNDVVRKVEIEDKCDLNRVGNGKEDSDDYVFVSDGIEVSGVDPDDTGGVNVVEIVAKSDLAEEGVVDPVVLESNGVAHESAEVKDDLDLENGSAVDSSLEIVKSIEEVADANGEVKTDGIVSEVTFDSESTLDPIESSKGRAFELDTAIKPSEESKSEVTVAESVSTPDVIDKTDELVSIPTPLSNTDCEVIVHDRPESVSTTIDKAVSEITVNGSDKPSEDLEFQVTANGPESFGSLIKEQEDQATVDDLGKPSENLECQVTTNGPEFSGSPIKEQEDQVTVVESGKTSEDLECQVTADGLESSGSPIKEEEELVTVDESGKQSKDLESQVTGDVPESCESPIVEQESKVSGDGLESFDSLVDKQECPVSVDEPEPSGNHTEKVDAISIVDGTDKKSEEHQEVLIMNSEVNVEAEPKHVCNGIKDEHQSELLSSPCPAENKKAERTEIGSGTELEENPDSELVLSEEADALANGQVEKFDGILQTGESQVSGTEADESEPSEKAKLEETHEKQVEGSSETLIESTEAVDTVENIEEMKEPVKIDDEMKEPVKIDDEIQESQIVVTGTVQDDLNLEVNTAESANEPDVPSEVETNIELTTHENTASQNEVSNGIDKPEEDSQPEGSAENFESLPSIDPVPIECKNDDLLTEKDSGDLLVENDNGAHSNPDDLTVVQQEVESEAKLVTENRSAENICCKTDIENVDVPDDEVNENEVKDAPVEFVAHLVTENMAAEVMNCGTEIENADVPDDEEKETEVKDAPVGEHSTLSFPESYVNPGPVIEFGSIGRHETTPNKHNDGDDLISEPVVANGNAKPSWGEESDILEQNVDDSHGERTRDTVSCPEVEDIDATQSDEIRTSSVEGSVSDIIDVQNEETEVLAYNFLIRIPRFEDESFRDQIRSAQLLVEEKTHIRDAIRIDIQGKRARLRAHNEAYNAAKLEETAARRLVRLKRQEIDSVQTVINRMKNAMSVDDIDARIYHTEQAIQHETLDLKDEKQFIREIKQLKTLRDQLASNMGTTEEIRQAIEQKDQNEERMKILRKELDSLKDKVSKAEAVVKAVGKRYDEENRKEKEMQAQFRVADDVRQKAYAHLNSLKKLSYDKNKNFRLYKEDAMAARDFVSRGDKDALHRLCANQVETFMEQWNSNDEFRKEYVSRCNMNASRRQRAFEGNSLVPDEVAPVQPSNDNESVNRSLVSIPAEVKTVLVLSAGEQGKIVSSTENKHADIKNKSMENLSGQKNQTLKTNGPAKPTLGSDVAMVTEPAVVTETTGKKEEENTVTKEEIELAKKDEELKKAEIEAKLKEQRRVEEKAKALEALERKKRNAEKAQLKAELRARKEAEQKEKEREKRLRKKEKKKSGGGDGSINGEEAASSESSNEATTKEIEPVKEIIKKKTQKPPAHFFSKQLKPKAIPPPLVNRNKKRWQQYGKFLLAAVAVLALFLVGNTGFFTNLKVTKFSGPI